LPELKIIRNHQEAFETRRRRKIKFTEIALGKRADILTVDPFIAI